MMPRGSARASSGAAWSRSRGSPVPAKPHMHNVLTSVRECAPGLADAMGRALGLTLLDLHIVDEVRAPDDDSDARGSGPGPKSTGSLRHEGGTGVGFAQRYARGPAAVQGHCHADA